MARKKHQRKHPVQDGEHSSAPAPRRRKRIHKQRDRVLAALGGLLVVYIGYSWWSISSFQEEFLGLAGTGAAALNQVQTYPSLGRTHLAAGASYNYGERFPTSGPHDIRPVAPGFYTELQRPTMLVHSLEHGHIVIYYDKPAPAILDQLKEWAGQYDGPWDGIVITPKANLGEEIVLTAWTRLLRLNPFDATAAAAFIDSYRGRGPENPVR
jgi:hypothetical protein